MPKPIVTPEMVAKLPVWARDHIKNLDHERNAAIRALNKFVDEQTPSLVYVEEHPSTGENGKPGPLSKRRYIQNTRVNMSFEPEGEETVMGTEFFINKPENRIEVRMPRGYPYIEPQGNGLFYLVANPNWNKP